jgi:glycosyltransferase involved in cell wall biosynthesis
MTYIQQQFAITNFIFTVSNYASTIIKKLFNKDATVIPNAVDERYFYDRETNHDSDEISIALIGDLASDFKCIGNILKAIDILVEEGYKIKTNWVSPVEPEGSNYLAVVNPKQIEIGNLLRASDIYICASMYESFCLPVLEAMSCRAAVITTNNGGVTDWVIDKHNALYIEKSNIQDIVLKVKTLIEDKKLRIKLANNGFGTSKKYHWDKTLDKLETYYHDIAQYRPKEVK